MKTINVPVERCSPAKGSRLQEANENQKVKVNICLYSCTCIFLCIKDQGSLSENEEFLF